MAREAESDLRELLAIPANYEVLFLQGGATAQFSVDPAEPRRAGGDRRLRDHRPLVEEGDRRGAASGRARSTWRRTRPARATPRFRAPRPLEAHPRRGLPALLPERDHRRRRVPLRARDRRRCRWWPTCPRPSCRARSTSAQFGVIYAGAQKNIGPSGLVVVIVREDLLGRARTDIPAVWSYRHMAADGSMLNTPPTFSWYCRRARVQVAEARRAGSPPWASAIAPRPGGSTPPSMGPASTATRWRVSAARG